MFKTVQNDQNALSQCNWLNLYDWIISWHFICKARASDDASTVRMKRASLVKAGEALSPDAFMLVLDGESSTKDPSTTKGPPTALGRLAGRAKQFEKGVSKAAGHLKRLGDENDQER